MLLIALASMLAGGTHSPAAAPVRPAKHTEQPGAASHREIAFLTALTPLLNVSDKPLSREEVAKSLNVALAVLRNSYGVTYTGDNRLEGWRAEFFTVADRFVLSVSFQGFANNTGDVGVDRIGAELVARGWTRVRPITHPFLLEAFTKDCRQVRIQHDLTNVIEFELLSDC
jgi:hypothetical protein